jgi:hypothetical protein
MSNLSNSGLPSPLVRRPGRRSTGGWSRCRKCRICRMGGGGVRGFGGGMGFDTGLSGCRICRICRICRMCRICRIGGCKVRRFGWRMAFDTELSRCRKCRICRIVVIGKAAARCDRRVFLGCRICRICRMLLDAVAGRGRGFSFRLSRGRRGRQQLSGCEHRISSAPKYHTEKRRFGESRRAVMEAKKI